MGKGSSDVSVLWLAENGYPAETKLLEHSHSEYYQIYYIMDGSGIFTVNGEDVKFESGMFFFFAPGVTHGLRITEPGAQGKLRMVEIKFAVFDQDLNEELLRLPAANQGTPELQDTYYQIFLEAVQKSAYYEPRVPYLFTAWLYQMISQRQRGNRSADKSDRSIRPALQVKQYIDEHYAEEVPLDELAAVTGYSKSYLCQIFREDTGMTINNYLNDVRISNAAKLLTDTDMSVAEVGEQCGYNSVFYFTKAFKKTMGIPPGSFRTSDLLGGQYVIGPVESVSTFMRNPKVITTLRSTKKEN